MRKTDSGKAKENDGNVVRLEDYTFSEFNVRFFSDSNPGRYYVNFNEWVLGLRAVISLTRSAWDKKLAGAILFVADGKPIPPPAEQPKRGGLVLYYRWQDFQAIYKTLMSYKEITDGTYGAIFKETYDDGGIEYGLAFTQMARNIPKLEKQKQ